MACRSSVRWPRPDKVKPNKTSSSSKLTFDFPEMDCEERLREMILYICAKCADDPAFGATKLNKILWFSDFLAYFQRGVPITGVAYQRLSRGPAPKRLVPVRE